MAFTAVSSLTPILEKQDTKVIEKKDPNPDDDCPCGSGKKFKDCCGKK